MLRPLICFFGNIAFLFKNRKLPSNPQNIVIMRSGGIGDVLMSTPLVKAIRLQFPNAKITYLVGEWSSDAIKGNPNVDKVMTYDDNIIFKQDKQEVKKLIERIKEEKFDLAFILDKAWQWNVLAFMAKIPFRLGFDRKGEGFACNISVPFDGKKYELEYYRDLAHIAGVEEAPYEMQFYITKKDGQKAEQLFKKHKLSKNRTIALIPGGAKNPGQELPEKRWPPHLYGRLADELLSKKWQIVILGGKTDEEICNSVIRNMKRKTAVNLCGKLSLGQSAAFMQNAKLAVTHDSGPMHLAAAMHTPLVAIFGPTDPMRFAPLSARIVQDTRLCPPCYDIYGNLKNQKGSLSAIAVDIVLKEILSTNEVKSKRKKRR
ncbi:MAG: lipopolysaccharide heptosyltransferase II [Nanoarchaeota archaeon]